jgi:hypothetical protein
MKIAIMDMDSMAYTIGHGNKIQISEEEGVPIYQRDDLGRLVYIEKTEEQIKEAAAFLFNEIMGKGDFTHYIGFIKGKNTIANKLKHNPDYKKDRAAEKPAWWDTVYKVLIEDYNVVICNNYEVDDFVVSYYKKTAHSHIVAIDSDILATEGTHYNWRKNEWVTVTEDQARFAFWCQMITGNHNNVKGLSKKGIKYAENLLKEIDIFKDNIASIMLTEYINHYKDVNIAIDEFYKNYKSLRVIDDIILDIENLYITEWKSL